ncbi:MAG: NlpC/P60 family protein [Gemmatimonadaceae bacterium]|jgi:NlpC/P60 family putative phage cell wall peptidase|nr:NlpC/P60 family protein [Gemmatimonadaceae bacterium]
MSPDELRAAVVAEALSWVGTPYRHLGAVKGVGADCAMTLVRVYAAVGIVPADFDPRPYAAEWYLHREEERYLAGLERWARRVETARPGDIALYRFGRTASHGAIVIDEETMVHAYRPLRAVVLQERRALADRLDSYWSVIPA